MNETRGRGRPSYAPTEINRRMVESMTACGVPAHEIAAVLNVDEKTLRKHFWNEIAIGQTKANYKVANALYQRALTEKGSAGVSAAIFWLKTRAGWRETSADEALGKKEMREHEAAHAAEGTTWDSLLN